MEDNRDKTSCTRRAAMSFVAAALPLWARPQKPATPVAHPVIHFEIGCRDKVKSARFFTDLFGWQIDGGPAGTIETAGTGGVPGHLTALGHEPQHYTQFYVEVEDVQAYLDKGVALGGKVVVPPIKTPTFTFAWLSDIDGNTIGLLKPVR
jgi:predicted enzyme related to lactoylglutathione lyase